MRKSFCVGALVLAACEPPPPEHPQHPQPSRAVELTILYTSDEHGWLQPSVHEGSRRGGVGQLLAELEAHDHGSTLLLSGGDNYTGPAVSGMFHGETMAQAMRRLGYVASAFGNHELDFGHEHFRNNAKTAGVAYLAANLRTTDGSEQTFTKPHLVIERGGVRIGVVGVATPDTPRAAAAHRFIGLAFDDIEATLAREIPRLWREDVDAVVVIAHECHDRIAPLIDRHPEWNVAFAGTGHCHRVSVELVDDTPVIGPDWRLEHYARVRLSIDKAKPRTERASVISYELLEVASDARQPPPSADPALDRQIAEWQAQVDRNMGEVIGHSEQGLAKKSRAIGQWILRSWLSRFRADVAVTTEGAIRQDLPPGPISLATVYSIMPFENELLLCTVPGAALSQMLQNPNAIVAGVREPIDPQRSYRVVTTDFLFWGGDGFSFHQHDPKPEATGLNWREPVIEWTRAQRSSADKPLERFVE